MYERRNIDIPAMVLSLTVQSVHPVSQFYTESSQLITLLKEELLARK
jgi:hypothetical protein